jgi:mono/diheme cytochrome c family protein
MLLIVSLPVYAGEGQQLHDQACLACHSALMSGKPEMMYLRTEKKITNPELLSKQVDQCVLAADVNWSEQQRALVVQYLRKQFYHF